MIKLKKGDFCVVLVFYNVKIYWLVLYIFLKVFLISSIDDIIKMVVLGYN